MLVTRGDGDQARPIACRKMRFVMPFPLVRTNRRACARAYTIPIPPQRPLAAPRIERNYFARDKTQVFQLAVFGANINRLVQHSAAGLTSE